MACVSAMGVQISNEIGFLKLKANFEKSETKINIENIESLNMNLGSIYAEFRFDAGCIEIKYKRTSSEKPSHSKLVEIVESTGVLSKSIVAHAPKNGTYSPNYISATLHIQSWRNFIKISFQQCDLEKLNNVEFDFPLIVTERFKIPIQINPNCKNEAPLKFSEYKRYRICSEEQYTYFTLIVGFVSIFSLLFILLLFLIYRWRQKKKMVKRILMVNQFRNMFTE